MSCPCNTGRVGTFLLVLCGYGLSLAGVVPFLDAIQHGCPKAIIWAVIAAIGLVCTLTGVASALSHEDAFRTGSFIWSVGVIAFCSYALMHGSPPTGSLQDQQVARGLFYAWASSNLYNVWLHLRGVLSVGRNAEPTWRSHQFQLPGRVTALLEEIEVHDLNPGYPMSAMFSHATPPMIEHAGVVPQIAYVKQGDALVPVLLPNAQMQRRLR